jgi:hypothetical protein
MGGIFTAPIDDLFPANTHVYKQRIILRLHAAQYAYAISALPAAINAMHNNGTRIIGVPAPIIR